MDILRRGIVFVAILGVLVRSAPRSDSAAPSGTFESSPPEDPSFRTGRAATPIYLPVPPCSKECQYRNREGVCVDDWNCIAMMSL